MSTAQLESSSPLPLEPEKGSGRLASLDVFRGLVILTMLLVNNVGDYRVVGYFWKHADWKPVSLRADLSAWMESPTFATFPLFTHCTLADYVMPMFMLIIGVALPFAAAASAKRGNVGARYWWGVVRRGMTLYALGWAIGLSLQFLSWRFSTKADAKLSFTLGMDVLQLLGVGYVVARVIYCLPAVPRLAAAAVLFLFHWALLRFLPQGEVPAGTFTAANNAVGYAYRNWWIFGGFAITPWLSFSIAGMLSVPCAAGTMLLGSVVGEVLMKREWTAGKRLARLGVFGGVLVVLGVAWAFDLPMNKPRWTPCYLLFTSGVGTLLIAVMYWAVDVRGWRGWIWPVTALGVNAIGIYFISIMVKIWTLNMVKVTAADGTVRSLTATVISTLQDATTPTVGSWLFTVSFVGVVWAAAMLAHWRKLIWKV